MGTYYIMKPNNFRDVQNLNRNKVSMDMTFREIELVTTSFCNQKYQTLTIHMAKDKDTGLYRLGLRSLLVSDTNPFYIN